MDLELLKALGFSKGETKVFTAILHTGNASNSMIHERVGMERRAVYDILNKLLRKGFITYTLEKNKKMYTCAPLERIEEKVKEKQEELVELEKMIPAMKEVHSSKKMNINIEVYRGKEGMKTLFESLLKYKKGRFIGGGYYIMDLLPHFWPQFDKRRIKKNVEWEVLARHEMKKRKVPSKKLFKVKYLPKELSGGPSVIFIFGNKIANVLWGEEVFAFVTESESIADSYRKYFKHLWKHANKA